ncbi:hypothetical protein [Brevundimonas sp. GCM10030266]|uniref:hypothetical protein n=1 Tax=Brevundimonas sp. GCM10030266 TaxID=3273386 RepID=UPI003608E98A
MSITREILQTARRFMADVIAANALAELDNQPQARSLIRQLADRAERDIPVVDGVVATLDRLTAEHQAAEGLHLAQRPAVGVGVQPHEHSNANDNHTATSELPATPVA